MPTAHLYGRRVAVQLHPRPVDRLGDRRGAGQHVVEVGRKADWRVEE